jgi:uncharacterized protein YbcI
MVALHREHFGRGPGAARSFANDDLVVCVLSEVYTAAERTLIEAGQAKHVRRTRSLHLEALEDRYRASAERILGRPILAFLSVAHVDPDLAVEVFVLGEGSA